MPELTFTSLNSGGKWGARSKGPSRYSVVPFGAEPGDWEARKEDSKFVSDIEALAKSKMTELLAGVKPDRLGNDKEARIDKPGGQAIMRAYLDLVNAAEAMEDAKYNGSELDLGLINPEWTVSTTAATYVCFLISAFVALAFVGVAVVFSIWGFDVHGNPTSNVTALMFYADEVPVVAPVDSNMTCAVESQDKFEFGKFLGVPDTKVFWNLYGGLVLGLIFGFLDNFGLFYGMGALDSFFYGFGANVAAGIMSWFRVEKASLNPKLLLRDLHTVTGDLMAGLGNTFSDLLGVALGTAALEIAKAGLNVDPAFWVLDLVAIVLGCLLGCFMPVLVKHQELLGGNTNNGKITLFAWVNIFGLFIAVLLAGVPYETFNIISVVIVILNIVSLVLLLSVAYCSGGSIRSSALANLSGVQSTKPTAPLVASQEI